MSFVWVQQWVALPVIYEGPMGDLIPGSRPQALDNTATGFARDGNQNLPPSSSSLYQSPDNTTPFHSQLSAIPHNQLRPDYRSQSHSSVQFPPKEHGASSLNMASMAGALPEYGPVDDGSVNPQGLQSSLSGLSTSAVVYQPGQSMQMPMHPSNTLPSHPSYGGSYATGPYQQQSFSQGPQHTAYPPFGVNQSRIPGGNSMQPAFQNYAQPSQYMYYPSPYGSQGQYNMGYAVQGAQNHAMYERRGSMAGASVGLTSSHAMDHQHHESAYTGARQGPGDQTGIGPAFNALYPRGQGKSTFSSLNQLGLIHYYQIPS
jgi:hypothetical protein